MNSDMLSEFTLSLLARIGVLFNYFVVCRYVERCVTKKKEGQPEPRATYHLIEPQLSIEKMKRKLNKMLSLGVIKKAPVSCTYFRLNQLIGYNTDEVHIVPARSLSCYQAALVSATGCSIEELGMMSTDSDFTTVYWQLR